MGVAVEIAVQDATGVRVALAEGADRVELCTALGLGGLTPSAALVAAAVEQATRDERPGFVHVLVRPRGGGFVYDAAEVALTVADIRFARATGAAGVVVGALDESATVDGEAMRRFVDAAEGLPVTFHRAFDIIGDQATALEELIALGVHRVLTSGGASRTIDGVATLRALAQRAGGRIQLMAGGGVRVDDIPTIASTGVDAVHLSARDSVVGGPSGPGGGEARYDITDAATVAEAVAVARLARLVR
ncbi:copper homeostasis protein CutC [Leifsonia sp. NPDC077715]|uniref:copper homeostasis protein CutC n=1 Tax=Leifsonia sp. NPDC077715 TaxID=3155539 RepID=UPI00342C3207